MYKLTHLGAAGSLGSAEYRRTVGGEMLTVSRLKGILCHGNRIQLGETFANNFQAIQSATVSDYYTL